MAVVVAVAVGVDVGAAVAVAVGVGLGVVVAVAVAVGVGADAVWVAKIWAATSVARASSLAWEALHAVRRRAANRQIRLASVR